jgi:TolB-like protein/Tfp pilus assembly protein PilF/predicted Ser/Thr protein kinase
VAIKCPKCHFENPADTRFCGNCAAPLTSAEDIALSKTMTIQQHEKFLSRGSIQAGKYRIIEPIGKGGMGVVYKAEDIKLERIVAVKFLPAELTEDPEAKERFVREARAAAALSHNHICTIHEIGEEENESFIVMEYVEGQSLKEKIRKGALDQAEALDIAIQVAEGLEEAHKKGIVHRDIKPGNIMLTDKGTSKVMDFGLAKVLGGSLITKEAKTMGTVAYMSPEQAKGEVVDQRTDIWSLGVVLYEMLTGQLPFKGEFEQSMIHSILNHEPEPLAKLRPHLPKGLEKVVLTALAKNPADRYRSMDEFLEDLKALAEGLKPLRAKVGLLRGKILGIKKAYALAGFACLIVLIALTMIFLIPKHGQVYDSVAILPLVNDSGDPSQDYFANSLTEIMINELYKVAALSVAPRQAVMTYKNSNKSPKEIANELNVKAIVEASVLKSGDRIRLTARMIDPYRNRIIWSETLEKDYSEILILQSELSQAIVSGIKVAVTPAEKTRLVTERNVVRQAYDVFLQGLDYWRTSSGQADLSQLEWLRNSLGWFQKAIDIDPTLAEAHAWKAHVCIQLGAMGYADEREVYPKAREAALEAMKIDPNLALAHRSLGLVKWIVDWDSGGAEHETKKALEIEPGDFLTKIVYLQILAFVGKGDEAITLLNRWIEEREKNKSKGAHNIQNTLLFLFAGYFKEALEEQKNVINNNPDSSQWGAVNILASAYALNGLDSEALAQFDKVKDLPGPQKDIVFQVNYAWTLGRSGRREEALERLENLRAVLVKNNVDPAYYAACVYAGLGDKDKAFEYLYQAYEKHSTLMLGLISDWWLHSLHGDPRFEDLREKMGFPKIH